LSMLHRHILAGRVEMKVGFRILKNVGRKSFVNCRFVGARYKDYPNIMWVVGGDYTPSWFERWTVDELAEGIREGGAINS